MKQHIILGIVLTTITLLTWILWPRQVHGDLEYRKAVEPVKEEPIEVLFAEVTAYSSEVEQTDGSPFTMASGLIVYDGAIACPRRYPFHTVVEIDGKRYSCLDRMNIRFDDRFDIWMSYTEDAIQFGIQNKKIKVYGIPKEVLQ